MLLRAAFSCLTALACPALSSLPLRAAQPAPTATASFTFAALGCMPYARHPDVDARFARVIAEINRHAPAFSVHLGDTMASDEKCTDALLMKRRADFDTFATALVYTPGDNEWTDTYSEKAGGYTPTERLARIRQIYFPTERSLGKKPIALITQRRDPTFSDFVENARWSHGGVVFATVHVTGSSNNHLPNVPGAIDEWRARDAANAAWIRATFSAARETNAPGLALFFQAQPFQTNRNAPGYRTGFEVFLKTVEAEARAFAKPVLLVHADEHRFRHEVGMRFENNSAPLPNVTRLETFGDRDFHAVLVTVDPGSAQVFLAAPLIVPGNPLPVLPRPAPVKK
ncbi:MAG: hypothetical protein JNL39_21250 [Opitutaceae bacterium]|nr:hypothetical protein [Opitutaceae bacterium]